MKPDRILSGIRVLDLSQYLAGPHCTLLLSGMGAEVIRLDNPRTGDSLSGAPVFYGEQGPTIQKRDDSDIGIAFLKRQRNIFEVLFELGFTCNRADLGTGFKRMAHYHCPC